MTEPLLAPFLLARISDDVDEALRDFGDDTSPGTWTAWMLAECEAKRRIIGLHDDWHVCVSGNGHGATDYAPDEPGMTVCPTLRALALPYAYHEDYRPEWTAATVETG